MKLADKIRKARESIVEVGGHKYTITRPTDAEALGLGGLTGLDIIKRFVIGWDHSSLSLGIPGGDASPVEFERDAWETWIEDKPELWPGLGEAITKAREDYVSARDATEKN